MTTDTLSSVEASWHALLSQLPTCGLTALRDALACDSSELIQGATVVPLSVADDGDRAPIGACALAYGVWRAFHLRTAREVDREFGSLCVKADVQAGEPAACRWGLNFYDEAPRAVAFALVLKVARLVLAQRKAEGLLLAALMG